MSKTIFLSSVSKEFRKFRGAFGRSLSRYKHLKLNYQELFFRSGKKTLAMLVEQVRDCDAIIHVIGGLEGWTPPSDQGRQFLNDHPRFAKNYPAVAKRAKAGKVSATQWEIWLASFFEKEVFAYQFEHKIIARSSQAAHMQLITQYHIHAHPVKNIPDLKDQIIGSLANSGYFDSKSKRSKPPQVISVSRILRHAPQQLFGREKWLDALDNAWKRSQQKGGRAEQPPLNVYVLVAWGGVGKTSLVAHWVSQRLAAKGWPGVERYFDWSFYSQGTGESRQTSSDLFIQEALKFCGDPDPLKGSPRERGERLASLIRQQRTLLVLDGIEPLQYSINDAQAGRLKDQALEALLQGLAADNPGLCIVTTREHLKNIESQATTAEEKLDSLGKEAAVALLRHLQMVGTEAEMEAAWKDAGGHALTLQLLGRFIADAYEDKDIRHYKKVKFEEADRETQGRSAFKVMIAYERWLKSAVAERQRELAILRLTGLFDRPMSRDCLQALRAKPAIVGLTDRLVKLKETDWNIALKRLCDIDLLTVTSESIDAHPLIREYFAAQLRKRHKKAFQAAHSRLFDHLCETTVHRPEGVNGLAPLYQAVVHGCLAGRHQEACDKVYIDRILRGTGPGGNYSTYKLGAIGADLAAVAAFFEEPWSRVSPQLSETHQAWLLSEAAFSLRALGRLTEALEPMRAGLEMAVQQQDWQNAAISANNLSELEVTLGRLRDAVTDANQSVRYADQSGDAFERMSDRTSAADALHQSGKRDEAGTLFAAAEQMQQEDQPEYNLLYSVPGFRYCEWLLAPAERAAWQILLRSTGVPPVEEAPGGDPHATILADVARRAKTIFEWRRGKIWNPNADPILGIALDHLTLARVGLLRAILEHPGPQPTLDLPHVAAAVNGLRNAGQVQELPRGLLTAAWYHAVRGDTPAAQATLTEAQQIAQRGPMPLFLADVHLHRARLFRDSDELTQAAQLIRSLGYGRRDAELADAEAAALRW